MPEATIEERVRNIVIKQLGAPPETVVPTTKFKYLGADSLDMVKLTMTVEKEFGVNINGEDADKLETIESVVNYLKELDAA